MVLIPLAALLNSSHTKENVPYAIKVQNNWSSGTLCFCWSQEYSTQLKWGKLNGWINKPTIVCMEWNDVWLCTQQCEVDICVGAIMGWMCDDLTRLRTVVCHSFDQMHCRRNTQTGPAWDFSRYSLFCLSCSPFHFLLLFLQSPDVSASSFFFFPLRLKHSIRTIACQRNQAITRHRSLMPPVHNHSLCYYNIQQCTNDSPVVDLLYIILVQTDLLGERWGN